MYYYLSFKWFITLWKYGFWLKILYEMPIRFHRIAIWMSSYCTVLLYYCYHERSKLKNILRAVMISMLYITWAFNYINWSLSLWFMMQYAKKVQLFHGTHVSSVSRSSFTWCGIFPRVNQDKFYTSGWTIYHW